MLNKQVEIIADNDSWPSGNIPSDIRNILGQWHPNLLIALIHTALWTRPPVSHGIHLSDFWAWLRYHRAISETDTDLRLCEEWQDIDPHQKTILSDELGVGFTTYLLAEKLGCIGFVDTIYLQKRLSRYFPVQSRKQRGRSKSPDYVSIDRSNGLYILECKGTQTSRSALKNAVSRGIEQKKSISISNPTLIKHSLVAGLFVPQWKNKKGRPCIMLADPTWREVEVALIESTPTNRNHSILQILLAKHFSLVGLSEIAQELVIGDAREFEFSEPMVNDIERWLNIPVVERMRVLLDTERDVGSVVQRNVGISYNLKFSVGLPKALEVALIRANNERDAASRDFRNFFEELYRDLFPLEERRFRDEIPDDPRRWRAYSSDSSSTVSSPVGFQFSLEMNRSNRTVAI